MPHLFHQCRRPVPIPRPAPAASSSGLPCRPFPFRAVLTVLDFFFVFAFSPLPFFVPVSCAPDNMRHQRRQQKDRQEQKQNALYNASQHPPQLIQYVQRLERGHGRHVHILQPLSHHVLFPVEQGKLGRAGGLRSFLPLAMRGTPPSAYSPFSRFRRISLARSITSRGKPRQARHLDSVGMRGPAGDDLAQENDPVVPFPDRDIEVLDPGRVTASSASSW